MRNRLFKLLRARDIENAKKLLSQASYQDIAQALQELPPGERQLALQLLSQGPSTWALCSPRFGMSAGTPLRHNPPRRIP